MQMAMAESSSNEVICKLKQIKPYTESQLFGFHSNPELDHNSSYVDKFIQDALNVDGCEFYQNVYQLNKWREALTKTTKQLSQLRSVADEERNRSWLLRNETIIKKSRCKDGRPVEAKHSFTEAIFQEKSLKSLEMSLTSLQETIINDYCYHHFMVQVSRKEIEYEINKISLKENIDGRINHIKQLLSSLFAFVRKTEMDDDSSNESIKQWISRLIAAIIPLASREDRLFILNHVLRCPGGISEWASGFVQCPSPMEASDNSEAIKILNHGMNMISTILSPIRGREKFIPGSSSVQSPSKPNDAIKDDYWHMIDPDIDEGEDVLINKVNLCEFDVIHLLKQVPFDDMLQFLTMGRTYPDDSDTGIFGSHSETSMLKLLAISTKMIQILRQGLLTFNCMRFRTLTDYITLLIRKTVSAVSKFWQECKGSFNNQDYALILRLQVEYDHFILRSVVTILSSQRFGVWKFVSVIPFVGVTESMMWHIVWVFYNNGRDEIDELGGLCPYFSDAYWKSKFNEPAMKYLFREKLPSLSGSEVECLLRSLSNMIQSRASDEVEFINTIACEMFEMSFLVSKLNLKMIVTCIETLTQCSNQHPFIISALINKINESSTENEMIIDLFTKLVTTEWKPSNEILDIVREWLIKQPLKSLYNRLARIILIKLNYGFCDQNTLHLKPSHHRIVAVMVYEAVIAHTTPIESLESVMKCTFRGFDFESVVKCAKGDSIHSFLEWAWRTLLLLKLHVKDFPASSSYQNDLHQMRKLAQESDPFYPIPNLLLDCDLFPICKGYETKNALALYLAIVMTEMGHNTSSFEDGIDILVHLLNNRCFIPCLNVLHGFVPVHRSNLHILATNSKFLNAFSNILHLDTCQEVDCLIGLIQNQIQNEKDKQDIIHFWIELLCESTNAIFLKSSSWFLSSTRGLQQLIHIIDGIVSHVFLHDESMTKLIEVFAAHLGAMNNMKLATSGWSRLLPLSSSSKKCDWTTPLHVLRDKYPEKVWLGYLLLKADSLRMEKIWESIVIEMGSNMDMTIEVAVKAICERFNHSPIPLNLLPINGWAKLIIEAPLNHTLLPLLFYNFFSCFFANSTSGGSSGLRMLIEPLHKNLRKKLETLVENNLRQASDKSDETSPEPSGSSNQPKSIMETTKFYRAALLWLQDLHLHDAFIDIDHLPGQYQIEMLKSIMNSSESYFRSFVEEDQISKENMIFFEMWDDLKKLKCPPYCEDTIKQCCELSVDLNLKSVSPPEEKIPNIMFYDLDLIPSIRANSKSLLNYLYSNIRTLMEEKSYCDNRSRKIHGLNLHLLDLIPSLYDHEKKELKVRVTCDKDGVYPDCAGSAIITIEFSVAVENPDKLKAIERNRIDFENVLSELLELPSDRVVCASIFINKCIPYLLEYSDQAADSPEYLLQSFLSWINDSSTVTFAPAKSLFNLLIDSLNFDERGKRDENSLFLLQTSLEKPSVIEYLGPRLAPSKCSIPCFLKMYELIQRNLHRTPPNILFVLLSKFDVNSWLKAATIEECHEFMNILINALFSIGIDADKDKSMLLGLYRKHLQYMFLCRFPEFLEPVISQLLLGMDKFVLYPLLWNDMLLSFGFFLRADHEKLEDVVREMRKYAESQPIFSSSELSSLITLFSDHFKKIKMEKSKIDLVEYFHIYIRPISIMLSTASSMWIFVNYKENNNFERTWEAYLGVWKPWLFSSSTSQTVDKKDFDLIWDLFMFNLHYFILTYSNFSTHILSNSWRILADYYAMTKHSTLTNVEAMQEKLKNLPWSQYTPSKEDLKLMYDASQHERCPPTILISHIIREVNWNAAAQGIPFENLPQTMEWLAGTVIFLADKPESFRLDSMPIYLMNSDQCRNTCRLLRHRIDLLILLQSRYDISQFYLKMIRVICGLTIGEEYFQSGSLKDEFRRKQIIYIDTICGIILDVVRSDLNPLKDKPERVSEFFRNCLSDIRPSMAEGQEHRGMIFATLLKFINSVTISDPDHFMLNCVFDFVNSDKTLILELLTSSFGAIKFLPLFILFSEKCIKAFAEADGKAAMIIERYVIPKDFDASIYRICNQNHAYLTLYVIYHIEKSSQEILPILSSMVEWSRHLKLEASSELQILALWYVLTRDISTNITADDACNSLLQSSIKLCRVQINFVEEVISQGFLSFMKLRKSSSIKTAFLVATMAGFLLRRLSEIFPSFHPLYNDLSNLMKTVTVKIQNIRKDKGFVGNIPLADKCLELMESDKKIDMEGIRLLRGWLLAFHSRDAIFRFILSNCEAGAS